jgi:hypothetical protein
MVEDQSFMSKKIVTFSMSPAIVAQLNDTAKHFGLSRSETLEWLLGRLATLERFGAVAPSRHAELALRSGPPTAAGAGAAGCNRDCAR